VNTKEVLLRYWVANVRNRLKNCLPKIHTKRYGKLREIGFLFRFAYSLDEDEQYFKQLIDFKKYHRHMHMDKNPSKIELCY